MPDLPINQVLLGDCVELMNALPEKCVDLVFADPPYNMQLGGDLLRPDLSHVDAVTDEWDQFGSFAEYDAFTRAWLAAARRVMRDTATLWVIGTYHNIHRVGAILMDLGYWILNDVVWVKTNPMPQMKGVRFCNAQETLIWAKKSEKVSGYTFRYRDMKSGNEDVQMRSDWYFPLCTGAERETVNGAKAHSTQKPEALLHRILASTSEPGQVVLDPFCGAGTTAAVAKRLGRNFITMDRDPGYVEVARKRLDAIVPTLFGEDDSIHIDAPKPRIAFVQLVEEGKLPPGTVLRLRKKDVRAVVNEDGTITVDGMRGSIHRIGAHCLGTAACNGWEHWLYEASPGRWLPIDALRPSALD